MNDTALWIGTTQGLYMFHKKNNTITPVAAMAGKYVRHIYQARDGNYWIGTYGQGFYTYRDGQFIALPLDKKATWLRPIVLWKMIMDTSGYLPIMACCKCEKWRWKPG
ncbi:two-component regulator propeller domain-containing protein [Paraflavitalea speifideaquila]|uniref:two-component regulator propeller domain-containing protein n=1 Tax=Paraflavitalea speifideaquila TaxID=3076558 RepID=UPI0028E64F25|nr:two-component regulator propeller domain-containing protein [Paraflavitalea speifideiaquila]